ncbi:MAG: biopolymer transporter ExbD [Candidatus Pseudobacter hemicellulosilyticus]|uniref:Biopolymer transporter ExbD n=1 Tax=Candidatus Pseudobacter hemicellulosilyticus TaxID=3121375 RepID=A0AAJ6BGP5_9BACT|nr:MAG: biopolymer transporter ExbD [Pseudobacter sp.]
MAEMNTPTTNEPKVGVRKSRKLSTKVDLTPMVDLGFLLITFFIFNTRLSEPMAMKLFLPADAKTPDKEMPVGESTALTLLAMGNDKVFYYHGSLTDALKKGEYGVTGYHVATGIGQVIRNKKLVMEQKERGFSKDMVLIIKPGNDASYQNVVDLLDETSINQVKRYSLTDISDFELQSALAHVSN